MSFTEIMYKGFLGHYLGETGTQSGLAFLMLSALGFLVVVLASYLLGSCNFAIIISGKLFKEDIRTYGSGNAGMTNMLRTYGKKAASFCRRTESGRFYPHRTADMGHCGRIRCRCCLYDRPCISCLLQI